ncbi:hypothetical protein HD806DRAFT_519527 [Xylariaceae sp. AK1471]|nr:hypothetical protein HD806DRAFT_519527 [Xylariaceae sp. AK1471]
MPSATQPVFSMVSPSAKKRRREDDDGEVQIPFSSTFEASQNLLSAINHNERLFLPSNRGSSSLFNVPRKAVPLPVSKKFRRAEDDHHEQLNNRYLHHNTIQSSAVSQSQPSHFSHAHPDLTSAASASSQQVRPVMRTNSSTLLSPCHICHRKPTKKTDLDSFADCMGCGERTCFVCIRACQGWPPVSDGGDSNSNHTVTEEQEVGEEDLSTSFTMQDVDDEEGTHNYADKITNAQKPEQRQKKGQGRGGARSWNGRGHRGVICSRCCVERGSEGDVVCLGCLAGMEGA